jgi:hypothetical protein
MIAIGVSIGNEMECSSGTISAWVKYVKENVYAMSNKHIFALENSTPIGILYSESIHPTSSDHLRQTSYEVVSVRYCLFLRPARRQDLSRQSG